MSAAPWQRLRYAGAELVQTSAGAAVTPRGRVRNAEPARTPRVCLASEVTTC